jgi:hypothetical protein
MRACALCGALFAVRGSGSTGKKFCGSECVAVYRKEYHRKRFAARYAANPQAHCDRVRIYNTSEKGKAKRRAYWRNRHKILLAATEEARATGRSKFAILQAWGVEIGRARETVMPKSTSHGQRLEGL